MNIPLYRDSSTSMGSNAIAKRLNIFDIAYNILKDKATKKYLYLIVDMTGDVYAAFNDRKTRNSSHRFESAFHVLSGHGRPIVLLKSFQRSWSCFNWIEFYFSTISLNLSIIMTFCTVLGIKFYAMYSGSLKSFVGIGKLLARTNVRSMRIDKGGHITERRWLMSRLHANLVRKTLPLIFLSFVLSIKHFKINRTNRTSIGLLTCKMNDRRLKIHILRKLVVLHINEKFYEKKEKKTG